MNKTININLGGIFFHIDENAYQKLRMYLDAIRKSLSDDPQGRDEIINDIESRISELLAEKIKDERQVISEKDIDDVVKVMGKPEDYLVDEEIFDDQKNYKKSSSKKLFRDGDDKFLGGVSSGIAHYFGIDSIWIRLAWLISVIGGFGLGIPIYIILWILLPEAESTAEKLQMKGEAVNISNIEKKIKEEFNDVGERIKNADYSKAKSGFQDFLDTLGNIIMSIFKVFGKFIGVLLIIIAVSTLIGLFVGAFSWGSIEILGFGEEFTHYPPFFYNSIIPSWILVVLTFLAVGIPFIVLFMLGLKILSSNIKSFSKTTKLSLLGVWLISILGLSFAGIDMATQSAFNGSQTVNEELVIIPIDTLSIKMVGNDQFTNTKYLQRRYDFETVYDNDVKKLYSTKIKVDIRKSDSDNAYLKIRKEAQGRSKLQANEFAEQIEYKFNLSEKNLLLDGYFLTEFNNKFKEQEVELTLYLPEDAIIYIDKSTRSYLRDVDNEQDIYDRDMPKHYYKMTENGLNCLDCPSDIIRNKDDDNFRLNINKDGIDIKVKDGKDNAVIKIDEHGIEIN